MRGLIKRYSKTPKLIGSDECLRFESRALKIKPNKLTPKISRPVIWFLKKNTRRDKTTPTERTFRIDAIKDSIGCVRNKVKGVKTNAE